MNRRGLTPFTLLANCSAQGVEPEAYLIEVTKLLPHDANIEQAAGLTPAHIAGEHRATAPEKPVPTRTRQRGRFWDANS